MLETAKKKGHPSHPRKEQAKQEFESLATQSEDPRAWVDAKVIWGYHGSITSRWIPSDTKGHQSIFWIHWSLQHLKHTKQIIQDPIPGYPEVDGMGSRRPQESNFAKEQTIRHQTTAMEALNRELKDWMLG